MSDRQPRKRTRRAVLAAVGTTLVGATAVTATADAGDSRTETRTETRTHNDVVQSSSAVTSGAGPRPGSGSGPGGRPSITTNNGIVAQFRDCSRVRLFGNPFAADLVSVFVGYYDTNGRWSDDVYDTDADLPMRIDVNEIFGDAAASQVSIGGVDVFERTEDGSRQLLTAQPPEGWNCYGQL